jgi:hypothetical protein
MRRANIKGQCPSQIPAGQRRERSGHLRRRAKLAPGDTAGPKSSQPMARKPAREALAESP